MAGRKKAGQDTAVQAAEAAEEIRLSGFGKFSDISGQDAIVRHLQNAIHTGTVSHAYLIVGEDMADMRQISDALSSVLVCEDRREEDGRTEPCGQCTGCIQAAAGDHPDIRVLVPAKTTSTGVDDIRDLTADIIYRPYRAPYRIFIIPDAEKMTVQAQNAVLKTLEEPPEYAVLILLSKGLTGFLPTLLSRCVCLQLKPVPDGMIAERIRQARGEMPEYADLLTVCASGSPGRALRLLEDEGFDAFARESLELLTGLPGKDAAEIAAFAEETAGNGHAELFLFICQVFVRDLLVAKAAGSDAALILSGNIQYISKTAGRLPFGTLDRMERITATAQQRLRARGSAQLILEAALLTLREEMRILT